jgi:phosphatidylinositol kinase/protein kinase (PI-3  family)
VHIDYGFILGDSPGFNINFESAPFKLTQEYVDVLGGVDSAAFQLFQVICIQPPLIL